MVDQPDHEGFCLSCETLFSGDWAAPEWGAQELPCAPLSSFWGAGGPQTPGTQQWSATNLGEFQRIFTTRHFSKRRRVLTMVPKTSSIVGNIILE